MNLFNRVRSNSRNGEVHGLVALILVFFAKSDWSFDTFLSGVLDRFTSTNSLMRKAIDSLTVYSKLSAADQARDVAYRSLYGLVTGFTHSPLSAVKGAADVVANVLGQYGLSITHCSYEQETSHIDSLLEDLEQANIVAACAEMQGVPEMVTSLGGAEAAFEALSVEQVEVGVAKGQVANATSLKADLLALVNNSLSPYLGTMADMNPDVYLDAAGAVAKIIDQNNELVKRRQTASEDPDEV